MSAVRLKFKIEGIPDLIKEFANFEPKVVRAGIKAGINEVTKRVNRDAKNRVVVRTRQLKRSIGRKVKSYRGGKVVVGIVGPRTGFRIIVDGKPIDPVKYAHLVEYGTRKTVAKPFMRPAWDAIRPVAIGLIRAAIEKKIAARIAKGRGKRG